MRKILWPTAPPLSGRSVRKQLFAYLSSLRQHAPRRGRGAYQRHFVEHAQAVTRRYAKGLFHCYDDPRIPQTSNAIESLNGTGKMNLRRCAGRASTANGPGSSCGRPHMFAMALHRAMPADKVEQLLRHYSVQEYREAKIVLSEIRAPAAQRRSFLRNPIATLKKILGHWLGRHG